MTSDWSQLSLQKHELDYILTEKCGKPATAENREILLAYVKTFKQSKGGQDTKEYTKEEFYSYLRQKGFCKQA